MGDNVSIHLFSIDFKIALIFTIAFFFLFPIIVIFKKRKIFIYSYFICYLFLLLAGVLLDITINYQTITLNILITNRWFSNTPIIANFSTLGILINLILLFPLGIIIPLLNSKLRIYKIILLGVSLSLLIEILQFSLPIKRYPELLDIINNTISVILGYMYYLFTHKIGGRTHDRIPKQKSNNKNKRIC